ncbi:MAG: hypothetical protein RBU45_05920 [Myxococcota bacterium]|nr:hypothetical protein [Myxococcota bacterium]
MSARPSSPVAAPSSPLAAPSSPLAPVVPGTSSPSAAGPSSPARPGPARHFRRNRAELAWFSCVLLLGVAFSGTMAAVLVERLRGSWGRGQVDPLVDGLWIAACLAIFVAVGLIGRELWRFLRQRVVIDAQGLQVGRGYLPWEQIVLAREGREFRSGGWFYHLEVQGRGGQRLWVTSGLIADYREFREEFQRHRQGAPLVLLPD